MSPSDSDETLEDAIVSILRKQEMEILPRDVACLTLSCSACHREWETAFRFAHSPYTGEIGRPLYRSLDEARAACVELLHTREGSIEESDWQASRRCTCRAPAHLVRTRRAHLVRALVGAGASLVLAAAAQEPSPLVTGLRIPWRGIAEPVELTEESIARAFGRPLALPRISASGNERVEVEPGVTLFRFDDESALRAAVMEHVEGSPSVVVPIDSEPGALAVVVERRSMWRRLRALGAPHGVVVEHPRPDRFDLRCGDILAVAFTHRIARNVATYGLCLADSCALALDETVAGVEKIRQFLDAVSRARPGARFEVTGAEARVVRPDGGRGPSFVLAGVGAKLEGGAEELAREAAYLCDVVPPWSDPTRVCPCGAPSSIEHRIVPYGAVTHAIADGDGQPWILRTWEREGAPRGAEVVVASCERHVRMLSERLLREQGLADPPALRARLDADLDRAWFAIETQTVQDEQGRLALIVRGRLAASLVLEPRWLVGVNAFAGAPFELGPVEVWAFGPDGMCIVDPLFRAQEREALAAAVAAAGGLHPSAPAPFSLRMEVTLAGGPAGRFATSGSSRSVIG